MTMPVLGNDGQGCRMTGDWWVDDGRRCMCMDDVGRGWALGWVEGRWGVLMDGKLIFVLLDHKTAHLAHCEDPLAPGSSQL